MSKNRTIQVPILARVEGEGALDLSIAKGDIQSLELKIYEPPRLFEKFLEGRSYSEVLDMVARICGICPVAYQMSAAHAIESCFEVKTSAWTREMRRLFYCGEWLESHTLHVHFLAAPDFLGFHSATEMAKVYPEDVRRGLRLQSYGNALIKLLGGRAVHPVGACIGGFYKAPDPQAVQELIRQGEERLADCEALIRWLVRLNLGDNRHDFCSVSLRHPDEYPMNEGRIVSNQGLDISIDEFDHVFKEHQVAYSTALHCLLEGKPYLVGPLARVNHNYEQLPTAIKSLLEECGLHFPSNNMLHSIIARAIEIYYCVIESLRILSDYQFSDQPCAEVVVKAGRGYGCTEAPRGLLWHCYDMDEKGLVQSARIIPPTSQNQARIEEDLNLSLKQFGLHKSDDELRAYAEMLIRNYDPCISCSTHFLKLKVQRND